MKKILLSIIVMSGLLACSQSKESLNGKTFALLPEKNITISFDEKEPRFYGQAVNNYFGTYKAEKNAITLNLQGSTMMAAPEAEMQKEQDYFAQLPKVKTYTLHNKTLELKGDNLVLKYEQTANQE